MDRVIDHTREIKNRMQIFQVNARDVCVFYEQRVSALVSTRECWNCVYGKFEIPTNCLNPKGICRFKKLEKISIKKKKILFR